MWKTAEPVVGDWIARHVGPAGLVEDAVEGLNAARHLLRRLPELAAQAEDLSARMSAMAKNGLALDATSIDALARAEANRNRWGHVALWVIALMAFLAVYFSLIVG
jgi:ubiquinone biosynthesis protein